MGSFMARAPPAAGTTEETSPASLLDDATMHLRLILVVTALLGIIVERLHKSMDGKILKPAKKLFFLAGVLALGLRATGVALEGDVALLGAAALLAVAVAVEASCARRDDRALACRQQGESGRSPRTGRVGHVGSLLARGSGGGTERSHRRERMSLRHLGWMTSAIGLVAPLCVSSGWARHRG